MWRTTGSEKSIGGHRAAHASSSTSVPPKVAPSLRGTAMASTDILAETVEQTVHHFLNAIRQRNVDGVAQTAMFINQSLVEAAERNRLAERHARRLSARQTESVVTPGQLGHWYASIPSPSLSQWIVSLDALAAAALPAALQFMHQLHTTQPVHFFTTSAGPLAGVRENTDEEAKQVLAAAQRCLGVLVNLCFFAIVAFRHVKTDMDVWCRLYASKGRGKGLLERFVYCGGDASHAMNRLVLERHVQQLEDIAAALRACFADHLSLLLFSADLQLWSIKEEGTVFVNGHPELGRLPRTPRYLADQDGWVWLLVAVSIHVLGPATPLSPINESEEKSPQCGGPAANTQQQLQQHRSGKFSGISPSRSSSQVFSASQSPRWRRGTAVAEAPSDGASGPPSPNSTVGNLHGMPSFCFGPSAAEVPAGSFLAREGTAANAAAATNATGTPLGKEQTKWSGGADLSAALSALAADPVRGGRDFASKYLSVLLSALGLYVKLWLRQRALPSHVMDVWRQRAARFPTTEVTREMLHQLRREMEDVDGAGWSGKLASSTLPAAPAAETPSGELTGLWNRSAMDDVSLALDCISDLVTHATPLFLHHPANFMELLRVLATVAPAQFFHVASARLNQSFAEAVRDREKGGARAKFIPLSFHWKCVQRFSDAVTRLFYASSDHVLENALALPVMGGYLAPSEACTTILALGCMHMVCESVLATKVHHGGAVSGADAVLPPPILPQSPFTTAAVAAGVIGGASALANDPALRAHWPSWARWVSAACAVFMSGDGRAPVAASTGGSPKWRELLKDGHIGRYCAGFAQSFGAAVEDVFALIMTIKTTSAGSGSGDDEDDVLLHGPFDLLGCLAMQRLRQLLYLLHDATLPSSSAHVAAAALATQAREQDWAERHPWACPFSYLTEESFNAMALLLQRYEDAFHGAGERPSHREYWLLAIGYLRLSTVDACCTSESHLNGSRGRAYPFTAFEGMSDFICAGPRDSVTYLRDRTYETYDEWLKRESSGSKARARQPRAEKAGRPAESSAKKSRDAWPVTPVDPAHLLRMEVRDGCDVLRERLLMSSARFLCTALRLACVRPKGTALAGGLHKPADATASPSPHGAFAPANAGPGALGEGHSRPRSDATALPDARGMLATIGAAGQALQDSPTSAPIASQAKVYVDAFTRFLLMMDSISSNRLMSCLRTFQEELRRGERRLRAASGALHTQAHAATLAEAPGTLLHRPPSCVLTDADVNEANLFEMEVALFSV